MLSIPNTTLCCIDCLNHHAAIQALSFSLAQCQFEQTLFFTDQVFELPSVEIILIPTLKSSQHYSQFILKELVHYVKTEFVILVQWDGYIINGELWRDDFFQYDYIGACWPQAHTSPQVGNGGFSFRSRKLLEALKDRDILSIGPEDEDICKRYREQLVTDYDIKFSPANIAETFSYERVTPTKPTFGFHGAFNLHNYINEWHACFENLAGSTFQNIEMLELANNYWRSGDVELATILIEKISAQLPDREDIQYLVKYFRKNKSTPVFNTAEILNAGLVRKKKGELQQAWHFFSLAALVDPNNAAAKNIMGCFVVQLNEPELAVKYFKAAVALNKDVPSYDINLATTYLKLNDHKHAIDILLSAIGKIVKV